MVLCARSSHVSSMPRRTRAQGRNGRRCCRQDFARSRGEPGTPVVHLRRSSRQGNSRPCSEVRDHPDKHQNDCNRSFHLAIFRPSSYLVDMINYGEELAYWHLRLNGCFLKTDFVLHRGEQIKNSSDNDVLAVRPIFGSEPLLEAPKDYDKFICDHTDQPRFLGIICQVKTGAQVSGNTNCLRQYLLCSIFPRADWQNRRG